VVVVVVVVVVVLAVVPGLLNPNPLRMIDWNMEATSTEGGSLILVTGEFVTLVFELIVCITLRRCGRPVTTRLTERESENILSRAASVVVVVVVGVEVEVEVVVVVSVFSCIEIRFEMMCPMEEASFWVCCNLSVCKGLSFSSSSFSSAGFNFTFIFSSISSFEGFFFFFFFCGFWVIFGDSCGSLVFLVFTCCCTCTECGLPLAGKCIEVARLQTFESWGEEEDEEEVEENLEEVEDL